MRKEETVKRWTYLFTFGFSLDVYANGNQRRMVDRKTGQISIEYTV